MMKRFFLTSIIFIFTCVPTYADCPLQKSTADTGFALGPFLDSTDGITPETALTITSAEVFLKKKGSTTFAAKNDATACTHRKDGWYTCPLNATDTDTTGNMIIEVTETGAVPVWRECFVQGSPSYDLDDGTTALLTALDTGLGESTTVATLATQVSFTLTDGPSNDDALNTTVMFAVATPGTEKGYAFVSDYTGITPAKTVTLAAGVPFTLAVGDTVRFFSYPNPATIIADLNDIAAGDAMGLTVAAVDLIWDEILETAGSTFTARCLLAAVLAYGAGEWTQSGSVITYQDPGGNLNRIVGTIQSPGFNTITITCPL